MNYKKIYKQIINKAQSRVSVEGYTEVHHITPKCLGGDNTRQNLVRLTGREHYLAHWLLYKANPRSRVLAFAWKAMTITKRERYTSHSFAYAREAASIHSKAYWNTEEGKAKKSFAAKNMPRSSRDRIREGQQNMPKASYAKCVAGGEEKVGVMNGMWKGYWLCEDKVFTCTRTAAKYFSISPQTVSDRSKNDKYNFKFIPKDQVPLDFLTIYPLIE